MLSASAMCRACISITISHFHVGTTCGLQEALQFAHMQYGQGTSEANSGTNHEHFKRCWLAQIRTKRWTEMLMEGTLVEYTVFYGRLDFLFQLSFIPCVSVKPSCLCWVLFHSCLPTLAFVSPSTDYVLCFSCAVNKGLFSLIGFTSACIHPHTHCPTECLANTRMQQHPLGLKMALWTPCLLSSCNNGSLRGERLVAG